MKKKGLKDFKEAILKGNTFNGKFKNVNSIEDVCQIAKNEGYEFSIDELKKEEISDDILDSVAGGKNDKEYITNVVNRTENTTVNFK